MLMRNMEQAAGLCNGTRLIVDSLGKNFIGATVITGIFFGEKVIIQRMNLVPTDPGLPFKFMRRQFCWNKGCFTSHLLSFDNNKVLKIINWIC